MKIPNIFKLFPKNKDLHDTAGSLSAKPGFWICYGSIGTNFEIGTIKGHVNQWNFHFNELGDFFSENSAIIDGLICAKTGNLFLCWQAPELAIKYRSVFFQYRKKECQEQSVSISTEQ